MMRAFTGPPRGAERQRVVDDVPHLGAAGYVAEVVLVVPKAVRPDPLVVDEQLLLDYCRDLRHPRHRDAQQRPHAVDHDQARMHALRDLLGDSRTPCRAA